MPLYDREERILNALMEKESMTVRELSNKLYVSLPTLRRDLIKLEEKGKLIRTHGGARLPQMAADKQVPILLREQEQNSAKAQIGQMATHYIKDGSTIMLDSSTSAYSIIPYLADFNNLIVITSSAKSALLLGQMGISTICTGGRMQPRSFAFFGDDAEHTVRSYNADILFFSCRGLSMEGVLTDKSIEENSLRKVMMHQCKKKILLCDSSKFGKTCFYDMGDISEVDDVISDAPLPESIAARLRER